MQSTDFKCFVFVQRDVELQQSETERVQRELLDLRAANRRLEEEAGKCFCQSTQSVFSLCCFCLLIPLSLFQGNMQLSLPRPARATCLSGSWKSVRPSSSS